ncbi:MAG: hypothetical protein IJ423_00460 [Clostridia bacterium]|nr:hypothetical protein [Clostridia bacterium]
MTNSKSTKRALLTSAMSMLLCVTMLLGTTFAWFTDSVTSANNVIKSGNLDLVVEYTLDGENWKGLDGATDLFQKGLWEPGHTEVVALRIKNNGSLALKYNANMNIVDEKIGKTKDGKDIILSEILNVSTLTFEEAGNDPVLGLNIAQETIRQAFIGENNIAWDAAVPLKSANVLEDEEKLIPGGIQYVTVKVDMEETVGNEANHDGTNVPSITFGINVFATQLESEEDSFGSDYDKDAKYPGEVGTAAELATALANNESVKLLNDITLTGEWTPIGNKDEGIYYTGTLDGNNHTISGLSVTSGDYAALISAAKGATIKNLTVEGSVSADNAAGVVARVEGNTVIENVTSNVAVKGTTKAGGIACNVTNSEKTIFTNCVNNGAVSGGDNGIGGIVGYVNNNAYVEIIACENNGDITSDNNKYAGVAVGYAAGTSKGIVAGMKNTGTVTGTLINDGRFLKYGDTVLCGYVGTIGNWTSALIATPENVQSVITNALEGATVQLSVGEYGTIDAKSDITIKGVPGAVVDCVNLNGASNVNLVNIEFDAAGAQAAYDKSGNQRSTANIISGSKDTAVGARNIVIDGCVFAGKFANGGAAIAFADKSRPTGGSGDVTIKNCNFNTENAYYDVYGYYTGNAGLTFTIENNTFASDCLGLPIYLGRLATSEAIVVKGNNFKTTDSLENSVYIQAHSATYTPTLSADNNSFGG